MLFGKLNEVIYLLLDLETFWIKEEEQMVDENIIVNSRGME